MDSFVKNSGTYTKIKNLFVKNSGTYVDCKKVYIKEGGIYKNVFTAPSEQILEFPYAPTTELDLRIATTSGQDWSIDWGDGVWEDYASSGTIDITKTFGSAASGVVRVRTVNGLSDIWYFRSTVGTWDFTNISKLTSLTILWLENNLFTGNMSGVSGLTSLTTLRLNSNLFTGNMAGVSGLTSLTTLYLNSNLFTGGMSGVVNITSLSYLYLNSNSFTGDMSGVANITSLTTLYLISNSFTGDMSGVANITSLTYFYLDGNFTINYTSKIWASNMRYFLFRPATSINPLGTAELDQLLQDFSETTWTGTKRIFADGNNGVRSSASDAAVATLQGMGVTLTLNT